MTARLVETFRGAGRVADSPAVVVAIPAKDEADRIGTCLTALAWQRGARVSETLILLNNCTDASVGAIAALAPRLPMPVCVMETRLPPEQANAGSARSMAMRLAAERAGPSGILITTDADGQVRQDWLSATLGALRQGAEVVCGRAEIDPEEARQIPARLHEDDARECAYGALLDCIESIVDPDPADPWPRHTEASGASIAVTVGAWARAGGVPAVPLGEDRAFVAALRRVDAVIRHAPDVRVTVSGRTAGRARGGMAETIARRIIRQDEFVDDGLEPVLVRLRRAALRARFRQVRVAGGGDATLARRLEVDPLLLAEALESRFFGQGWETVEAASPRLRRKGVSRVELAGEASAAAAVLRRLGKMRPARIARAIPQGQSRAVSARTDLSG